MYVAALLRCSTSMMRVGCLPRRCKQAALLLVCAASALNAQAADEAPNAPASVLSAQPDSVEAKPVLEGAAAQAAELDKPLRGVSMQAHVGGGYSVLDRKIASSTTFPQLTGRNELLGAGPAVDVTLGVDLLQWLSLQISGGMTLAGARRADYVHSLAQSYGAVGVRVSLPFRARWNVNLAPAIGYFRQDNEVDPPQSGVGILGQVGVEYFAHVRHFSLGADLAIQAPLAPTRVFIGVLPHVRYTF
jgi:hypothetical protein